MKVSIFSKLIIILVFIADLDESFICARMVLVDDNNVTLFGNMEEAMAYE